MALLIRKATATTTWRPAVAAGKTVRLDLGTATNNETEYRTLIAALKDLVGRIQEAGRSPANYSVLVYTDSPLIVGQVTQGWQVKAANVPPLIDEARSLLKAFGRHDLVKVPRDEIVRVLGQQYTRMRCHARPYRFDYLFRGLNGE